MKMQNDLRSGLKYEDDYHSNLNEFNRPNKEAPKTEENYIL